MFLHYCPWKKNKKEDEEDEMRAKQNSEMLKVLMSEHGPHIKNKEKMYFIYWFVMFWNISVKMLCIIAIAPIYMGINFILL